jgi:hypothetical protein
LTELFAAAFVGLGIARDRGFVEKAAVVVVGRTLRGDVEVN